MAGVREIKSRIKSVRETRQITKAMKLISAVKLKKARQQLEQTLPFFEKVRATIGDILLHSGGINNRYFDLRAGKEVRKKCFIVLAGDKSLAGGYNHTLVKFAEGIIAEDSSDLLLVAGHMGRSTLARKHYNIDGDFDFPVQDPTVYRARDLTARVIDLFKTGETDEVYVIFTQMISSLKLEPRMIKLLPLELDSFKECMEECNEVDDALLYEPSPQAVFDILVPKYIKGILYGAFVEAFTSEQSARMTAMDNATSNADEMLQKLNLHYNRARQAAITQEISEIVGGASALNN